MGSAYTASKIHLVEIIFEFEKNLRFLFQANLDVTMTDVASMKNTYATGIWIARTVAMNQR